LRLAGKIFLPVSCAALTAITLFAFESREHREVYSDIRAAADGLEQLYSEWLDETGSPVDALRLVTFYYDGLVTRYGPCRRNSKDAEEALAYLELTFKLLKQHL